MRKSARALSAFSAAACGVYVVSDRGLREKGTAIAHGSWRASKLLGTVSVIAADYKMMEWTSQKSRAPQQVADKLDAANRLLEKADAAAKRAEAKLSDAISRKVPPQELTRLKREAKEALDIAAERAEEMVRAALEAKMSVQSDAWRAVHKRSAEKLLWLARENRGVYIKLAQHLSQMDYLLPDEYTQTLRPCLDDAPRSTPEQVRKTILEELGDYPENIFMTFEPQPIASASLAQVHIAMIANPGGPPQKLAVKVQHRGLRESAQGDVEAISFAVHVLSRIFPSMPLWWIADELAPNLPVELDFLHEAHNANRCREMFKADPRVVVPEILHHMSTPRVLCMSFESGCTSTDVASIRAMGLSTRRVASLIAEVFCAQIFLHRFVHCDPHPANLLVRVMPGRQHDPQLVILDHGLYRELDKDFVHDYSLLWRALVFGDVELIRRQCQVFGAGEMYPLLAAMLTARPWNDIVDSDRGALVVPDTDEDKDKIKTYAAKYALDITSIMNKVPRQMLLLFKANDCLRHLDRRLGSPVNTLHITARISNRAIAQEEARQGMAGWVRSIVSTWRVEVALFSWWLMRAAGILIRVGPKGWDQV